MTVRPFGVHRPFADQSGGGGAGGAREEREATGQSSTGMGVKRRGDGSESECVTEATRAQEAL